MSEETELDFELENLEDDKKIERIRNLSTKVKTTAEERDKLAQEKADAEAKAGGMEKDLNFYKNFNQMSSKYQGASDYQEKILEKVRGGYDIEDATLAVLGREGKLNQESPPTSKESPAGGSATNQITKSEKTLGDMTIEEKRQALMDAQGRGEIGWS